MLERFSEYIKDHGLFFEDSKILMALSGGIDSMVMADLFIRSEIETGIAHCNFCLRGSESDKDEILVKKLANRHSIPFFSIRFNTKEYARENGISTQMAARDLRYRWFEEIREKNGFDFIAVAHNLNDNIETILINLTRGTGITGLSGIRPAGNKIIRPILFATREEISEYCRSHKITYREDRSNAETKYVRNKIRHLVIPVLKEINPSIEFTLGETAERIYGITELVRKHIEDIEKELIKRKKDTYHISISQLKPHLSNKSVIYELFKKFGITGSGLGDLYNVIKGKTGGHIITETHSLVRNRDELIITVVRDYSSEDPISIKNLLQLRKMDMIQEAKVINMTKRSEIPKDPMTASIDFGTITFPLIFRRWKKGDSFCPLGMDRKKKLSDYFIDRKLSLSEKKNVWIVESEGKIVWIVGERIDNRFRITSDTKKVLFIKVKGN